MGAISPPMSRLPHATFGLLPCPAHLSRLKIKPCFAKPSSTSRIVLVSCRLDEAISVISSANTTWVMLLLVPAAPMRVPQPNLFHLWMRASRMWMSWIELAANSNQLLVSDWLNWADAGMGWCKCGNRNWGGIPIIEIYKSNSKF